MQVSRRNAYATIRTDGGLLPADLLARIAEGDRSIEGLTPESYHLAKSERLNEAATRAWNRLQGAWEGFRAGMDKLPASDTGTTLTRERWLLILFQELGYGRLQTARTIDIEGKSYPISHIWQSNPVHLVSFRQELDRRTPGARGASRVSPHSLVQELLNRCDDYLWGFASNGLRLRLLRDNASLTRAACVEFDLQSMMEGEVYSDFFLLFLLCHQSRVEVPEGKTVEHCWLERWYNTSLREGTRVLDHLRDGVERAIEALGGGFLGHPANTALRDKLRAGTLTTQDYYRQVLRVVYRLLFLFVAEDRDLLLLPAGEDDRLVAARDLYTRHYSTQRLRRLAERRRSARHADLYRALRLVFAKLHSGCPELALPALGSYLFAPTSTPDLNDADIANADLLAAVWNLTFTADGNVRRSVDYRNLGPEELGSVYESLLEMHPDVHLEAGKFELRVAAGSERKTTGSYYTPTSLVNCLLDSALEPVLDEACQKADPDQALLDLKVCDPACGSGHFLIAAARRIAKRLAAVRAGEDEPAPDSIQHALRDVVGRCIYGVDINPMAVELCKINLWLEALEPGRPLSFLEHHIRPGNSLLGTTPALMKRGIPDDAFKPIEGDDRAFCSELKRRNRDERRGQGLFSFSQPNWLKLGNLVQSFANLADDDDSTPEALAAKEQRFVELVRSAPYENARLVADAWCAAFVCEKQLGVSLEITEGVFRRWEENPHHLRPTEKEAIIQLRDQYNFFHWHLAFPEVFKPKPTDQIGEDELTGWSGGFDLMLGNPPWETMSPDAKEFFAVYDPQVRFLSKAEQDTLIEALQEDPAVKARWLQHRRELFASVHFMRNSERYSLFAEGNLGKGDFDSYRMFVETALRTTAYGRMAAQIVKSGIYSGANAQAIRKELFENWNLLLLIGFINAGQRWFPNVHPETRFALYVARKAGPTEELHAAFLVDGPESLLQAMREPVLIPLRTVYEQSPKALAVPETTSSLELPVTRKLYAAWPAFGDQTAGPPRRHYQRELDMGNDRDLFGDASEGLPVFEGRMVDQYDYRAKAYRSGRGRAAVWEELPFGSPEKAIIPQWRLPRENVPSKLGDRVDRYRIGFCDVATPTAPRSLVAALIPPGVICGHKVPTIRFPEGWEWAYMVWLAAANSLCMDFLVRKKISLTMSLTVVDSLPFPRLEKSQPTTRRLVDIALRLCCTGPEMAGYWNTMAHDGWCEQVPPDSIPPGICTEASRAQARASVDAIVARDVYGIDRQELAFIIDAFDPLRRHEERSCGEFVTRRLVLEAFDSLAAEPSHAAEQVQIGRAVAYLNLLLHTWGKPVVRDALEAGLVFMLNDSIRQRVLRGTRPSKAAPAGRGHFLSGVDAVLSNMKAKGAIDTRTDTGRMVVSVGRQAVTVANAPAADVAKAKEAIQAVQKLGESRTAAEYAGVLDVEYALV